MINAILINKTTNQILKQGPYPREDMQLVTGLDSNLEWLIEYIPDPIPDYDSRIYSLNIQRTITDSYHPVYTWLRIYMISYGIQKRPNTEIQNAVTEKERLSNEALFPMEKQLKLIALSIGILFKNISGITYTQKEQAIKDKMMALALKIWQNDQTMRDKFAEIAGNLEPDIDTNWQITES